MPLDQPPLKNNKGSGSDYDFLFAFWVIFRPFFLSSAGFFFKTTSSQNSFRNTIRVSSSLDPDQARYFVRPDVGPNCLQRLSADDTSRQRVTL